MDKYIEKMANADAADQLPAPQTGRKFYVVNYKETTTDKFGVMTVECGTFDVAYEDENQAIKKCYEATDEILNRFLDDLDENCEKLESGERAEDDGKCYRETSANGDWQTVYHYGDTYEYRVYMVTVL